MTPDQFEAIASKFAGMNPRPKDKMSTTQYTSAAEIREKVMEQLHETTAKLPQKAKDFSVTGTRKLSDKERIELAEKWVERGINIARQRGVLMTDQQLADWRIGRRLVIGDRAKYIGPTREELTLAGLFVPRPQEQSGTIIAVEADMNGSRVLTFMPDKAETPVKLEETTSQESQFVALEVREFTIDWLMIERCPL